MLRSSWACSCSCCSDSPSSRAHRMDSRMSCSNLLVRSRRARTSLVLNVLYSSSQTSQHRLFRCTKSISTVHLNPVSCQSVISTASVRYLYVLDISHVYENALLGQHGKERECRAPMAHHNACSAVCIALVLLLTRVECRHKGNTAVAAIAPLFQIGDAQRTPVTTRCLRVH